MSVSRISVCSEPATRFITPMSSYVDADLMLLMLQGIDLTLQSLIFVACTSLQIVWIETALMLMLLCFRCTPASP